MQKWKKKLWKSPFFHAEKALFSYEIAKMKCTDEYL